MQRRISSLRGVRTVGTTEVRTHPLERAPEWLGLPGTEERGRGPVDGRGRDALGWEAPRVGALKVSGWCARGCLGAAVALGAAPDGLVRPGAGLDPRGRRRIAAEIPDWAVYCARRRIRTRAHPEGGGCGSERLLASWHPARGAEPGASWLRNCTQREDGGPALGTPPWGTHNRCAGVGSPGARGCRRRDSTPRATRDER
ncbi:hypothetical protein NDU88_001748 [Pleurodeles waltl]|uniref:Uncharacterized protein n=1 Tax=Pleurodeles waltl TaxID=8319 RepID=A0AAV7UV77_PLEWA|nr:hypothetical protein NDU88_001748 [Pleurodeles waltl]